MKIGSIAHTLARYADLLERSDASSAAARVRAFAEALQPAASHDVRELAESCAGMRFPGSREPYRLRELVPTLEVLLQLLDGIAKLEIIVDLERLLAIAREHGDTSVVGFASVIRKQVVSASKGQSKKGAAQMDQSLVDDYLKKLEAALGDDAAFKTLFRELEADKRVTKVEAIELATRFLGPTPTGTSRLKALQRVLQRHQKLVDFRRSSESIRRGRSAA
jgi:hypothetical protein